MLSWTCVKLHLAWQHILQTHVCHGLVIHSPWSTILNTALPALGTVKILKKGILKGNIKIVVVRVFVISFWWENCFKQRYSLWSHPFACALVLENASFRSHTVLRIIYVSPSEMECHGFPEWEFKAFVST